MSQGKHRLSNARKAMKNARSFVRDLTCDIHVHTVWMTCQSTAALEGAGGGLK